MNDKNLIRRCKALAVHACANWRDHECLARDCPCDMAQPRYATIHDGAISCDYFLKSVLPLDKELNRLVCCSILVDEERTQPNIRFCTVCGSAFVPTSPRQKYCSIPSFPSPQMTVSNLSWITSGRSNTAHCRSSASVMTTSISRARSYPARPSSVALTHRTVKPTALL